MDKYNLVVTTAFGVESVTKKELIKLGFSDPKAIDGSFHLNGTALDAARLNMFLRTGERVYIKLGEYRAESFDELFDGASRLPFEDYLSADSAIILNGKSVKSKLFSLSDCQKLLKKAILNRLQNKLRVRVFPESGARSEIVFSIKSDIVTLLLNTTGKGLHKRGYRDFVGEAPIKETLACALLYLSDFSADKPFIDPFCGSGTIVIEAALIALNIAPGKNREFDYMFWEKFDKNAHNLALAEALEKEEPKKLRFAGYDIDPSAIKLSLRHAERAGIKDCVHFQTRNAAELSSPYEYGCIVTNPPYGERLMTPKETDILYKTFGERCREMPSWSVNVITSAPLFEKFFGKKSARNRKFFNANKECHYYQFPTAHPPVNKN